MKYTKQTLQDKRIQFDVTFDKTEWEEAVQTAYEKNKGKYSVQGFRKGHAPRKVLEKTYGSSLFYDDAIDGCFYKGYFEILSKEKDLQPVANPSIEIKSIDEGLNMVLYVTTKPDVELGEYKGLTITKEKVSVKKEEVDHELEHMREHQTKYVEVERAIKEGDIATIDFSGSVDGKKFDGGTAQDYDLEIGSHSFIDNFEDQLVGLKKGDSKDVKVKFPEDYHEEKLKGKPAVFEIKVKAVKEKVLPVLDDKFASEVSEFETLEELKKDTEKKILERKQKEAEEKLESKLIEKIIDSSKVEIPQVMIDEQIEDFIKDFEYRLSYQGLNLDGFLKYSGQTLDQLKASRKEDAKKTCKTRLVFEQIILKEKIKVTDKDLEEKFNENSDKKKTIEEIKKTLGQEQLNYFENTLLLNKLMKFLKKNNNLE